MYKIVSTHLSILALLILAIIYSGCETKPERVEPLISIDFENNPTHKHNFTKLSGSAFSQNVYEGKKSFRLEGDREPFVLTTYLHPGKIYKVSLWTNLHPDENKIWLSARTEYKKRKTLYAENTHSRVHNGWYHLELIINTSWWVETQNTVLVIKSLNGPVLIDLFKVEELLGLPAEHSLSFNKDELNTVAERRDSIIPHELIERRFKKKMPARLNGNEVAVKFKGDWSDHVLGGIWSLKTYSKSNIANDTKTLTFQNLKSRNFLKEWMYLRLCRDNGILAPSFDISTVSINNGTAYACALEESFSDDFVYRKRGYHAPVLRLYEDHFLAKTVYGFQHAYAQSSHVANSYIYPYDKNTYLEGEDRQLYLSHAEILKQFINEHSIIELVDKEKWATYFAIQSLTKSYHNSSWHNSRWFVNDKNLIEPIAYDGNSSNGEYENLYGNTCYGDLDQYLDPKEPIPSKLFQNKLFMNKEFMTIYKAKLSHFTDPKIIQELLDDVQGDLSNALEKVQAYYDYDYSTEYIFSNAQNIRKGIPELFNSEWYNKEYLLDLTLEKDELPYIPLFIENYVRIHELNKDSLMVINGVNSQITISSEVKENIVIPGNSKTTFKDNSTDNYFVVVDSNTIRLPVIPWVSVY